MTERARRGSPAGTAKPSQNTYLVLGDWQYWTIGGDYASEKINVVNRCEPAWATQGP